MKKYNGEPVATDDYKVPVVKEEPLTGYIVGDMYYLDLDDWTVDLIKCYGYYEKTTERMYKNSLVRVTYNLELHWATDTGEYDEYVIVQDLRGQAGFVNKRYLKLDKKETEIDKWYDLKDKQMRVLTNSIDNRVIIRETSDIDIKTSLQLNPNYKTWLLVDGDHVEIEDNVCNTQFVKIRFNEDDYSKNIKEKYKKTGYILLNI